MGNSHSVEDTEKMRAKRLSEIKRWLAAYQREMKDTHAVDIEYIPDAAEALNEIYWNTVESKVRPKLSEVGEDDKLHTIDRHKIISVTEGCIMNILPIAAKGLVAAYARQREANAMLALAFGQNFLFQWMAGSFPLNLVKFDLFEDEPFEREHISWLCQVSGSSFPIFSNSATWYMYEKYITLKLESEAKKRGL